MKYHVVSDIENIPTFPGDILCIPILRDHLAHRKQTQLSFIYVYDLVDKNEYIINVSHHDVPKTKNLFLLKKLTAHTVYAYNKSYIDFIFPNNSIEVNILHWCEFNHAMEIKYIEEIEIYYRWYNTLKNVNDIIPLMCWLTYCRNLKAQCVSIIHNIGITDVSKFYNNLYKNLINIENAGISTNPKLTKKFIGVETNQLFSQYNLYTATGRPSNHFNSVNFAALNKRSGIREMIIPSAPNGWLIEWDYDSMHIRLVSDLIGIQLPTGNLHEYFARLYFKTPIIDDELYLKSKNLTWRLIYGNIEYEYLNIPFVRSVYEFRRKLWAEFKEKQYIELPISKRKIKKENFIDKPTSNLIFNYLMQGYETEYNSLMLEDIFKYLYKKKSKLILYTYDSFLFDYDPEDGKNFLNDITNLLSSKGIQTTVKYGRTYNNMVKR